MFQFVASLFGCSHQRCTFPMTSGKPGMAGHESQASRSTYIVCLDCGREFPYDWQQMKVVAARKAA